MPFCPCAARANLPTSAHGCPRFAQISWATFFSRHFGGLYPKIERKVNNIIIYAHEKKNNPPREKLFWPRVVTRKNYFFWGVLFFAWATWATWASPEIIKEIHAHPHFAQWATRAKTPAHLAFL